MKGVKLFSVILALVFVFVLALASCKTTEVKVTPEEFFKGKIITLNVAYDPGGTYDLAARLLAPSLAAYTGADVTVRFMPGAGTMKCANYMYEGAKRDGLELGYISGISPILNQLTGKEEVKYEIDKFTWIGQVEGEPYGVMVDVSVPYAAPGDLLKLKELKLGTIGVITGQGLYHAAFAEALGLDNMKMVIGYGGLSEIYVAIQRGEVHGTATSLGVGAMSTYVEKGICKGICTFTPKRSSWLPNCPTIFELAEQLGQPLAGMRKKWVDTAMAGLYFTHSVFGPPGVPKDRVEFLRDAFMKAVGDKAFLGHVKKAGLFAGGQSVRGDELEKLLGQIRMSEEELKAFIYTLTQKYAK